MLLTRIKPVDLTVSIVIVLLLLNGLIVSLLKYLGVTLHYSVASALIFASFPIAFVKYMQNLFVVKNFIIVVFNISITLLTVLACIKLLVFDAHLNTQAIKSVAFYLMPIYFFYIPLGLSLDRSKSKLRLIGTLGAIAIAIGIIQYLFRDILPTEFTELPRIDSLTIEKDYVREIDGNVLFRPNGLIGNPITYGFAIIIFLNLYLTGNVHGGSLVKYGLILTSIILMIILASRANISLTILSLAIFALQKYNYKKISIAIFSLALAVYLIATVGSKFFATVKHVIDRFTLADHYSYASLIEHINDYVAAYTYFYSNPILGAPFGLFSGNNAIITDGFWFAALVDFGLVLFVPFVTIWMCLILISYRVSHKSELIGLVFSTMICITIANFLNSAFSSKSMYCLIWLLLGLVVNLLNVDKGKSVHEL